jgi:hypothetical protein
MAPVTNADQYLSMDRTGTFADQILLMLAAQYEFTLLGQVKIPETNSVVEMVFSHASGVVLVAQYDGGGAWRYIIVEPDGTIGTVNTNNGESLEDYFDSIDIRSN